MAQQQKMVLSGQQNTKAFSDLDAKMEKLGGTIRDLEAQYNSLAPQIDAATAAAKEFDSTNKKVESSSSSTLSSLKRLAGAYLSVQGLSALLNLSDTMTQNAARLERMNDGLQDTAELNQMIYESAQRSRGSYLATAELVSKLGTLAGNAFDSSSEIVSFAEQINKQIALSGASTQAADAALLQLTQGLSSGVLRGEELNSVLEQTPTIAQTIADYMGVTTGEMRELAGEGQVTAEVVKNALLGAAKDTNKAFENMPMTWSQVWASFQNTAIMASQPILSGINMLANNLDIVAPAALTAGAAFSVFMVAANWTNICTGTTAALTAAQKALTTAMATGWALPLIAIIAIVGGIYLVTAAVNKLMGTSVSATGIIAGAFFTMGAYVHNSVLVPLQNGFAAFVNFIGNVFNDPVTAIKVLFYDMGLTVLGYIRSLAGGIEGLINAIPGVQVSLTSGIDSLYNSMSASREAAIASGSYKEYIKPWEYKDLSQAFSSGYNWGSNLSLFDFGGGLASSASYTPYNELASSVSDISDSVGAIEKSVAMSDEDLKSLVDVAERRYVNRINVTAQTPVINITGQNTGNTAADRMNLADTIRDILIEQVAAGSTRNTARAY